MSHPLDAFFPKAIVRLALKQKVAETHPVCHYCGQRVAVTALVRRDGKLMRPTYRNGLFGFRTFLPHPAADGEPCQGSGQRLCIARGWDR